MTLPPPAPPFTQPFRCDPNRSAGTPGIVTLNAAGYRRAKAEISTWPGYAPTPLASLPAVAARLRLGAVHVKDESSRFGLGSFKALGGAYAVLNRVRAELAKAGAAPHATTADLESGIHAAASAGITVCCATDGNHGRSVAWGARRFGARCIIFVHEGVSLGRADAIAAYGAEVRRAGATYDDSVREAAAAADRHGWHVVSDTSWPGYTEIPREIMQGYRLMADEALAAMPAPPTHILIQAGVGGAAAAVAVQARAQLPTPMPNQVQPPPAIIVVESDQADCLRLSNAAGHPVASSGALDTIMAGLACGEPSLLAWQELQRSAAAFMAIPDAAVVDAMRDLAAAGIVSGESGAAGYAALALAAGDPAARRTLGLDGSSRVLLFSTEGATDPALYARLVH